MRIGRKKGISVLEVVNFDGWDVLAPVGLVALILPYVVEGAPTFLIPIGIALLVLWLVTVFVVSTRKKKPDSAGAGGV